MIEQEMIKVLVSFVVGGTLGFIVNTLESHRNKEQAIKDAVQSLLRDRLIEKYRLFKTMGEMTILDKENMDALFEEYKKLGGNGMIKELMEDLENTKIKVINVKE